jgi:phosphatidylglycerophosphate synthase
MFDAVVLADSPHAKHRILGLSLAERGRRVAKKAGARRILVIDDAASRSELATWNAERGDASLLVIDARDQLVHSPLVDPLIGKASGFRLQASGSDLYSVVGADGAAAGAWLARGTMADSAIAKLAAGALPEGGEPIAHGDVARHAATTPEERAGASRMLLRLIIKHEDSPITNYVYRPISRPLTRLLVWTPITPNGVSLFVLVLGMLGCSFTAQPGHADLAIGAAIVLLAGIIDGCDGEIARLKVMSSKLGAWLDTVVDELTTTMYFLAIGYHTYVHHPLAWVGGSIVFGLVCYVATIYGIYYFLIRVSKTGNSQHYIGDLEIAGDGLRRKQRPASKLPAWVLKAGAVLAFVVRRDFINLGALVIALFDAYRLLYTLMFIGGVATAVIIVPEHLRLRRQLRELSRRGASPRLVA